MCIAGCFLNPIPLFHPLTCFTFFCWICWTGRNMWRTERRGNESLIVSVQDDNNVIPLSAIKKMVAVCVQHFLFEGRAKHLSLVIDRKSVGRAIIRRCYSKNSTDKPEPCYLMIHLQALKDGINIETQTWKSKNNSSCRIVKMNKEKEINEGEKKAGI